LLLLLLPPLPLPPLLLLLLLLLLLQDWSTAVSLLMGACNKLVKDGISKVSRLA
jgi:hypothetical protein